jgi:hypothetical protein
MSYHNHGNHPKNDSDCRDCVDKDNATQKSITRERGKICELLYTSAGEVARQEERFKSENDLYNARKCLFVNTEDNYRRYRNLDITVGTEMIQTNESIKANVASFSKWNKDLNTLLKNIAKAVKDTKAKFAELKKAAGDLEICYNDSCNAAQRKALTGKLEDCKDESTPPDACKDSDTIINELICMPKGLTTDIDSIFKSAHDVVGIQVFSNIDSLDPLQKTLDEQSKLFKTHLGEVVKVRETDLKKQQEELVKSVQEITKSAMERNSTRSSYEGYYDATDFLCCPTCKCVETEKSDSNSSSKNANNNNYDCDKECPPRLTQCAKDICEICEDVKETFCCGKNEPSKKS